MHYDAPMDASHYFKGKRVTVMGLGLLGRGVGDVRYLAGCGAELIVTDLKTREELAESLAQLKEFPNILFVLGEHRLADFSDRDLILKTAGVPLDSLYIAQAKKNNIPVRMSADLFAEISNIPIIGVTGTRGKSTVTHMLYAILKKAGEKVLLGGNVVGVSTLSLLSEVTPESSAVLELDSWQLQGWGEKSMSPHLAVFTTLYRDHMNYYHDDMNAYLADKAYIFLHQTSADTLVLGAQCAATVIDTYGDKIKSNILVVDEHTLPPTWTLRIPGIHNRYDAALSLAAARAHGIPDDVSREALESFPGVPGRLELILEKNGIKVYNDTTSTTSEATLAALNALHTGAKNIVLIMGGADKGLAMDALVAKLSEVKKVILLAGSGTERIRTSLPDAPVFTDFKAAVAAACASVGAGDLILFSPAFASFGMFKNEYDRGDQFVKLIHELPYDWHF